MTLLGEWLRRIRYLLNRRQEDEVLRREMESHRAMMAEPRRFGNPLRLREESHDVWGWTWLDDLVRDLRFALRALRRAPGFTLVSIASLALATGATTVIFSIVNSVLLRPLPFADPDRLVRVYGRNWAEDRGTPDEVTGPIGSRELLEYMNTSTLLDGFAGYSKTTRLLRGASGQERLIAVQADLNLFSVLGADSLVGRTFRPGDSLDVAVISFRLWRERFEADPSLPGRVVTLDDRPVTILGVMPDVFQFPYAAASLMPGALAEARTDVWVPQAPLRPSATGEPRRGRSTVISRLKPGVDLDRALAELRVIAARVEAELYRGTKTRVGVRLLPLNDVVLGPVRRSLWMLFAAVGLVLAAACANMANLLLARMTVRTHEVVTRAALGASPQRLVRQFLAESLLISVAGGLAGVAIARWGTGVIVALGAATIPRAHEIALDWQAFAFLLIVCLMTAVLFGLAPAFTAARVDVHEVTKDAGGRATLGGTYGRLRDGLAVLEVALAFVLAVGAAALVMEVLNLRRVETGMRIDNVLTLHLTPRTSPRDYYAIEARVAQLPGVTAAGFTQLVPLQNWGWEGGFEIRGRAPDEQRRQRSELRYVTPGYFKAMGIPVLQGRGFAESDSESAPRVIVINQALAREYFPNEDPVGRILDRGAIIGVVGSVRDSGLDQPVEPTIYYAAAQNVAMVTDIGFSLIVHTVDRPETYTDAVRAAVREINPNLAIFNVRTMRRVVDDSLWGLNLYLGLIGVFAALALVLAAMGLYGVISYNVTSRMREFAVRLALGSEPNLLARLVISRALRLAALGLAAGIFVTLTLSPLVQILPLGVRIGPVSYATIAVLLLAIATVAGLVPAVRVARVDAATALRHD
jgi:putative ABC transport system permease protein